MRLEVLERARTRIAKEVSRGGHLAVGLGAAAEEGDVLVLQVCLFG